MESLSLSLTTYEVTLYSDVHPCHDRGKLPNINVETQIPLKLYY